MVNLNPGPSLRSRILFMALAVGFVACASGAGYRRTTSRTGAVTAEAIAGITAGSAYEVVEKLRGSWLESRGPKSLRDPSPAYPMVFVDGARAGELIFLRSIPASAVAEISFLSASESALRYGLGFLGGIIEVTTRR